MDLLICGQIFSVSEPRPEFDDIFCEFANRKVTEVPIITFFCKTPQGKKVALLVHKVIYTQFYPKFYLEIPNSCTIDPLSLCFKLEKLFDSTSPSIIHSITQVLSYSVYGYQKHKSRFYKIEVYNAGNIRRLAEISLDGIEGFSFQPYEMHIDTFQHFFAEFGVTGMDWITVNSPLFRQGSTLEGINLSNYSKSTRLENECDSVYLNINKRVVNIGPEFGLITIPPVYKIWTVLYK